MRAVLLWSLGMVIMAAFVVLIVVAFWAAFGYLAYHLALLIAGWIS